MEFKIWRKHLKRGVSGSCSKSLSLVSENNKPLSIRRRLVPSLRNELWRLSPEPEHLACLWTSVKLCHCIRSGFNSSRTPLRTSPHVTMDWLTGRSASRIQGLLSAPKTRSEAYPKTRTSLGVKTQPQPQPHGNRLSGINSRKWESVGANRAGK